MRFRVITDAVTLLPEIETPSRPLPPPPVKTCGLIDATSNAGVAGWPHTAAIKFIATIVRNIRGPPCFFVTSLLLKSFLVKAYTQRVTELLPRRDAFRQSSSVTHGFHGIDANPGPGRNISHQQ